MGYLLSHVSENRLVVRTRMCIHEEHVMEIKSSIQIDRSRSDVFKFMSDMRNHSKEDGSKVLIVDKMTESEIGMGTRFRELVGMLPLIKVSFMNEITQFEPEDSLGITWHGGGMEGILRFRFEEINDGTLIMLHETVKPRGLMRLFRSLMRKSFSDTWENRLKGIQHFLEMGVL